MITHGLMSFGAANECDARDKNKIATIGTRRSSRRSRRGQDCDARNEDMITTLATRKRSRRSRRGQDCDARNEDKIATLATMTDRYDVLQQTQKKYHEDIIATLATRKRSQRSRRGQDCSARNKDKIATLATMTDHYDDPQQTQKI